MSLPHVVLIPGFWEGPSVYDAVVSSLKAHSYSAQTIPLCSTGQPSPNNPSMKDDVAVFRSVIAPLVEKEEKDVLLILHSAGGFLGPMAIEGLSSKERAATGKKGGVSKIVFLTGAIWEEGFKHVPLPFFDYQVSNAICSLLFSSNTTDQQTHINHALAYLTRCFATSLPLKDFPFTCCRENHQGNEMYCKDPAALLFNDLDPSTASSWVSKLRCQPSSGWDDVVDYVGWKNVPSVYLICEQDAILNPEMQKQMAKMAESQVERCSAGHCCMIGQPKR
ncbi:MAG: hypothetical protein Q9172_005667 [Xanthocarpia lactea]